MRTQTTSRLPVRRNLALILVVAVAGMTLISVEAQTSSSPPMALVTAVNHSAAPDYTVQVSVVGADAAANLSLPAEAFKLADSLDKTDIPVTGVRQVNAGVAVMMVMDLGGLNQRSQRGVLYQEEVERLGRQLVEVLKESSPEAQNYAGFIVATGTDGSAIGQIVPPTNDLGMLGNSLEPIKTMKVAPSTALYDGLNEAFRQLQSTPGIENKRKAIVLFSDGADAKFSGEAILGNIAALARERHVPIYTLHVRKRTGIEARNMMVLASQSSGLYALVDLPRDEADATARVIYDAVASLRNQYEVGFRAVRPLGEHSAMLTVRADTGDLTGEARFISDLKPPQARITSPADLTELAQPSDGTVAPITLTAEIDYPDGKNRPVSVTFRVNNVALPDSERTAPPYEVIWTPDPQAETTVTQTKTFMVDAQVADSWLSGGVSSSKPARVDIHVPVKAAGVVVKDSLAENIPLVIALCGLGVVVLLLFVLLVSANRRMNAQVRQLAGKVAQGGVGGIIRNATRRLMPGQQAIAELEVIQGSMKGQVLRVYSKDAWIGRDSTCEVVVNDDYVSKQHCRLSFDEAAGQYSILDEGSANGTWINRARVQPTMRIPIQPDTQIQVGSTVMVFRVGRKTQRLAQPTQQVP